MMASYTAAARELWASEVVVVGGGSAGCTAALAAAREGAQVTLVERYGFLGGTGTQVLDTFYGFYTPGKLRRKVVGGVPDLVVEGLRERGAMLVRPNTYGAGDGITYDPEMLKLVWEELLLAAGVRLLYHCLVLDVLREGDRVVGVVLASKAGLLTLRAQQLIDASGDADVAAAAGVAYEGPSTGAPVQSGTTTFRMINVDEARARAVKKDELHRLMGQAIESGQYRLPRREGSVHITPLAGVMVTNMTRVADVDGTDPVNLTAAEIEGRRQAGEYARFLREQVPGYEQALLGGLSVQIGVRESRRIIGAYRLTREDVVQARQFEDAIAVCGAPIEEHHSGADTRWEYLPDGQAYGIPYRCLLPKQVDRLLVAGRCLSADHDAHASVRSIGQCMAMGQAAGVAAAMAVRQGIGPHELSVGQLRDRLRSLGAVLDGLAEA
ncbi:MAG: FAD-dependent oxidoreductase [Roseiflexaceae bacterium]